MYIMVCHTSCILAGAFILASIGTCFLVDKKELGSPYLKMLSPEKKKKYLNIVKERRNIYLQGFGIGFVVALLALVAMNNNKQLKMTKLSNICTVLYGVVSPDIFAISGCPNTFVTLTKLPISRLETPAFIVSKSLDFLRSL